MPILSVIMATYKEYQMYLRKCVDSILSQTFDDFEFIVVVEPEDANISFLRNVQDMDRRVVVIENEKRLGVAGSRNRAIKASTGKYVAIIDGDDYCDPFRFEKQILFLEKNPDVSLVGSNLYLIDDRGFVIGERVYPEWHDDIKQTFLLTMAVANPSVMTYRDELFEAGFFNEAFRKAEDLELWLRFLKMGKKMHNIQEPLVYYRVAGNDSSKRNKTHWKNIYAARKSHSRYIWSLPYRFASLTLWFGVSLLPESFMNNVLCTKGVQKLKHIKKTAGHLMNIVIIAGGKGTRLGLKDIPKPMIEIAGKPLLEHQINLAKKYGIKDIYILSGHLADNIINYFGDGSKWDVNITHIVEKQPLGTAGAIKQLENKIKDRFMVFYGDVIFDIDMKAFIDFDRAVDAIASIVVHPNDHPYDSDLVEINDGNIVTTFHSKPHDEDKYYRNLVNAAVYILSPEIFKYIPEDKTTDFGKDIFPLLLESKETIAAYKTAEYLKDIGTPERFEKVNNDFMSGKINRFSKRYKSHAIFIDRDGTLIKDVDMLHKIKDLELFPFSANAIKKINSSDNLCFLITNQPVVARNMCDIHTVSIIHNKLETLLGREGAYLNDIYFCPHHPDKGYSGENTILKVDCECRKPKTGMIDKAAAEYNVDMENSWFIGDTTVDVKTGINSGMKTVLVKTGKCGKDKKYDISPDFVSDNLEDAVDFILQKQGEKI